MAQPPTTWSRTSGTGSYAGYIRSPSPPVRRIKRSKLSYILDKATATNGSVDLIAAMLV